MGWASGSSVFSKIITSAKKHVEDPEIRYRLYKDLIKVFEEDADCDTLYECVLDQEDAQFDRAFMELNPDYDEHDDEDED